ncbi:hypothetical protein CI109_101203 [Kwoniella shandongensis]|uniref:Uncharacterized protein n=1 Tax=Kwoniella shandongensis TaxID=1734106 RepID=A0A5M6BVD4_9TREE|nr:uncharacterized protein CI109_005479 [Kwoniella shandongensis]KAA5526201.1 hypothetical protein CI109_005479 [Kwoniella shandongensis]
MGSSSSKAVRKLPTASTLSRSSPATRAQPPPPPPPESEPETQAQTGPSGPGAVDSPLWHERSMGGQERRAQESPEVMGGMGKVHFSGEKDDGILKDAMDPQFMRNLSRLGPVEIHDAGKFVPAQAQRTLSSRREEFTSPTALPPPNHLSVPLLISLLDRLKTLPPGTDPSSVYEEYGMQKREMDDLRKWVNSVSVSEEDDVRVENGEEIREMKAVWVGGLSRK